MFDQFQEENMPFANVKGVFSMMPEVFNATAAQGLNAIFQPDITGERGGTWNVVIRDGACQINESIHESPNVTLTMSAETWLGIVNRELDGMQAFLSGKLMASGNIMLAQRIAQLFQF
jgi:putative sterol carrier protein